MLITTVYANSKPRLTLEVSDKERAVAKAAKKEFKDLLKQLDDALRLIFDLRDAIVKERPSQKDLQGKYRGRLLRYRRKIQETFNQYLKDLKKAVESLKPISDSETNKLKEIIVSEFDELSDGIEAFLELMSDVDRDGFTEKVERLCTQFERRKKSISEVIDNQLFAHIDTDILGRKKVSHRKLASISMDKKEYISLKAGIHRRIRLLRMIPRREHV